MWTTPRLRSCRDGIDAHHGDAPCLLRGAAIAIAQQPGAAHAVKDCLQDCLQNCARLVAGSKEYCKDNCISSIAGRST